MSDHREHLESLRRTLEAAHQSGNNAIIPPRQAGEGAEAIKEAQEKVDSAAKWSWAYPLRS